MLDEAVNQLFAAWLGEDFKDLDDGNNSGNARIFFLFLISSGDHFMLPLPAAAGTRAVAPGGAPFVAKLLALKSVLGSASILFLLF